MSPKNPSTSTSPPPGAAEITALYHTQLFFFLIEAQTQVYMTSTLLTVISQVNLLITFFGPGDGICA